jgi:hypothetical protein
MADLYQFVGGPQDGTEAAVGVSVSLGTEISVPVIRENRTAVYVFGDDGRFHFHHYGATPLLNIPQREAGQELAQISQRVNHALEELDAFFKSQGGYPQSLTLGLWKLERLPG